MKDPDTDVSDPKQSFTRLRELVAAAVAVFENETGLDVHPLYDAASETYARFYVDKPGWTIDLSIKLEVDQLETTPGCPGEH